MSSSDSDASSSSASSVEVPSTKLQKRKQLEITAEDSFSDSDSEVGDKPEAEDDQPPLSHAEQRRQKKKAKRAAAEGETEGEKPVKKRKLNDGKAEAANQPKGKHSVWVGNLAFKTTADDLRTFFDGCGEITRVHLPTKASARPGGTPENRGFAYVDFATIEAKTLAITRSENPLTGRKLLIKDGTDFTGRPKAEESVGGTTHSKAAQKILKAQKQPPAPTLFFGNLSFSTTEESIKELLNAHRDTKNSRKAPPAAETEEGEAADPTKSDWIRKVRMGTFEDSGLCKGFAFVDFTTIEHATSALINPRNHRLDGRDLVVEYASADAVRRGAPKDKSQPRPFGEGQRKDRKSPRNVRKEARAAKSTPSAVPDIAKIAVKVEKAPASTEVATDTPEPERRFSKHGKHAREKEATTVRSRPRPGAALALAKRESAAIIPSQGKKITF